MNSTEGIREEVAQLVRQDIVDAVDDVLHGATFDGRRLVVAAGERLARLIPDSARVVDQLETFPDPGGLAYSEGISGSTARAASSSSISERVSCCAPSRPT